MEAGEYGLTRGTCFVARRLEVVAVAGLLWISWCVLGAAGFRVFHDFGEGATKASQSAYRELAPTDPHQVYQLLCSNLKIMASVDQESS